MEIPGDQEAIFAAEDTPGVCMEREFVGISNSRPRDSETAKAGVSRLWWLTPWVVPVTSMGTVAPFELH